MSDYTVEGHPVEVLSRGRTALVKTRDGELIHVENAFGLTGYSDFGWVPLNKLEQIVDEIDPPTCVMQPGIPYPCLTCDPYIKGRCQQ
jgi:hypothetical protein